MIEGVVVKPLARISDERGTILKMQESSDPEYLGFGEVYFSTVYPGVVKGWHLHESNVLNYAVVKGMVKLVLFDDREGSPTRGELMELFIGERDHKLVQIPAMVWNGFKGIGVDEAIVCDVTTLTHGEDVMRRLDPHDNDVIPYDWGRKDR
ncbi:MAG: dTDP-4-dehydrorhamnose 3,5-epimerase family protein [Coriobacteriia bacterium]